MGLIVYLVLVAILAPSMLAGAAWLVRALIRTREEGPPGRWALSLAVAVLLAMPVGAACAYFFLPAPASKRGVTNSIERETDAGLIPSECSKTRDGRWHCSVYDSSSSGTSEYDVSAGWSCWHARRTADNAEFPMPPRPEGCTTLRDALGLFDLVVN